MTIEATFDPAWYDEPQHLEPGKCYVYKEKEIRMWDGTGRVHVQHGDMFLCLSSVKTTVRLYHMKSQSIIKVYVSKKHYQSHLPESDWFVLCKEI